MQQSRSLNIICRLEFGPFFLNGYINYNSRMLYYPVGSLTYSLFVIGSDGQGTLLKIIQKFS